MRTHINNRRVVSKARYFGIMSRRITQTVLSLLFLFVGIGGILTLFLILSIASFPSPGHHMALLILAMFVLMGVCGVILGWLGLKAVAAEGQVIPLTRQTVQELSEQESLVRASSATDVAVETVLMRPSYSDNETPKEELLRSA
jgi:hypothetical protein